MQDGLWRYQLGDVVTVDGQPVIKYSERRQYVFQRTYLPYHVLTIVITPSLSFSSIYRGTTNRRRVHHRKGTLGRYLSGRRTRCARVRCA